MKERLNFEQAYTESLAYRELSRSNASTDDLDEISLRMDSSRAILDLIATDTKLADLAEKHRTPFQFKIKGVAEYERSAISYAISDMPYIDPQRALVSYKDQLDRFDLTGYGEAFATAASIGLKALTLVQGDETIELWRRFHDVAGPRLYGHSTVRNLLQSNIKELSEREDVNLSERFVEKVIGRNLSTTITNMHGVVVMSPYIRYYPAPQPKRITREDRKYEREMEMERQEREDELREIREALAAERLM